MMVRSIGAATAKWTLYPSLLYTLENPKQRDAFESACCAQYCGRFEDGAAIYLTDLPASETKPVLALQHADMLTHQGRDNARIELLRLALANLPTNADESGLAGVRLLMECMVADAEFWAEGKTKPAVKNIEAVKEFFQGRNIQGLNDIELRIILLFHQMIISIRKVSNFLGKTYDAIFAESGFDTAIELNRLRKQLYKGQRLQFACQFLKVELNYTPSTKLKDTLDDAKVLCDELEQSGVAPLQFRAVGLKQKMSFMTATQDKVALLWRESLSTLSQIKPAEFSTWQAYFPSLALENARDSFIQSETTSRVKVKALLELAAEARRQLDYTQANQCYIAARNAAYEWRAKAEGVIEIGSAMQQLLVLHEAYIDFHDNVSHMHYFAGAATVDYLHTLRLGGLNPEKILNVIRDFTTTHPDFAIPSSQERIHDAGLVAARELGLSQETDAFKKSYRDWLVKCHFWKGGEGLSEDAIRDPDYSFRMIQHGTSDPLVWGENAVGLLLHWAAWEWDAKLLSSEELRYLLSKTLGLSITTSDNPVKILKTRETRIAVYKSLMEAVADSSSYGTDDTPQSTESFMARYSRLRHWVLLDERPPSREARIFALKIVLTARLRRFRDAMRETNDGVPGKEQAADYEVETAALNELDGLEAALKGAAIRNQEKESAVHVTLVKAFAVRDGAAAGLITEAELAQCAGDCRQLVTQAHDAQQPLREYHALCQLMRLTWQQHVLFSKALPETAERVMALVREAQDVFVKVKNQIVGLDAPDILIARVKLADDFRFREHHNYALLGRLSSFNHYEKLYRTSGIQDFRNQAQSDVLNLAMWARRSKGSGFTDLLNLEIQTERAIEAAKQTELGNKNPPIDTLSIYQSGGLGPFETDPVSSSQTLRAAQQGLPHVLSPRYPEWVRVPQFAEMLNSLPRNIVIVDFINVPYIQAGPTLLALVYRQQQMGNSPIPIPVLTMTGVNKWVMTNLNVGEDPETTNHLSEADAGAKLAELSGLLTPLLTAEPQVAIQPGETIVFCPTGSLNRIPLHAIPVEEGGPPLIVRNPVVYCQSLTLLHWLYQKTAKASSSLASTSGVAPHRGTPRLPKTAVINPLPESNKRGEPTASTSRVKDLARALHAEGRAFQHGASLDPQAVLDATRDCSVLHFHGHVVYQPGAALDSRLALNAQAARRWSTRKPAAAHFLAARDFFRPDARLAEPAALATLVGCGSGVGAVSSTDDVLGFPTALFYAGATAVVGTLWPLPDEDGAAFGTAFYGALFKERDLVGRASVGMLTQEQTEEAQGSTAGSFFASAVDLAKVFRESILAIRQDAARQDRKAPYHWASFALNGFWYFPISSLPAAILSTDLPDRTAAMSAVGHSELQEE
ncbi:hypothetical protein GQ53DRAFT_875052 [Thozetella sp. PMI_491]|nr:hypothetical protein GQ53DRAFT_875052 [Thozetella sp. PMI_491]